MQYFVLKSGFEILDVCRAYGLAQVLHALARGTAAPVISDAGQGFVIEMDPPPASMDPSGSDEWQAVFSLNTWEHVFLTYKAKWTEQRDKVGVAFERRLKELLDKDAGDLAVNFDGPCTLPGALEPGAFKGLKGLTARDYAEGPTSADELNWALACLGAVVAQRYRPQRVTGGKREFYVTLPVPEKVRFSDFHAVRQLVYDKEVSYHGVRGAVAHFSVLLADAVRDKAAGNPHFPLRFSGVLYFSMFRSGNQYKPAIGGAFQTGKLIAMALSGRSAVADVFKTWDYLFRRGATTGAEDLADAATELIMAPSLDSYFRHARVFLRYIVDSNKKVKSENLYTEQGLMEVMNYVV
ncbi:MAG: hypothetical protein ACP5U2_09745 [Bryobacteraceae bacterium]